MQNPFAIALTIGALALAAPQSGAAHPHPEHTRTDNQGTMPNMDGGNCNLDTAWPTPSNARHSLNCRHGQPHGGGGIALTCNRAGTTVTFGDDLGRWLRFTAPHGEPWQVELRRDDERTHWRTADRTVHDAIVTRLRQRGQFTYGRADHDRERTIIATEHLYGHPDEHVLQAYEARCAAAQPPLAAE